MDSETAHILRNETDEVRARRLQMPALGIKQGGGLATLIVSAGLERPEQYIMNDENQTGASIAPEGSQSTDERNSQTEAALSALARQLEPDPARLARLREAILNGTYSVAASEVSARMIDEHLADLKKGVE